MSEFNPSVELVDVRALPDIYAMRCSGDCMEPDFPDGGALAFDKTAPYHSGDDVIIWLRPELVFEGGFQAVVKRLCLAAPPDLTFPYDPHAQSDVIPVVLVEQLNPPRTMAISCERIAAIHRCLGSVESDSDGYACLPASMVEEARS